MVCPICKDLIFLAQKAENATPEDKQVALDLLDTLKANAAGCVGLAANMIGVNKRVIAFNMGMTNVAMFNPVITKKRQPYETEEGCLSLVGVRKCTRYKEIVVDYEDMDFKKQRRRFTGWTAEIIQHEIDHTQGIII